MNGKSQKPPLTPTSDVAIMQVSNERSEYAVLQEQLRFWENMHKQTGSRVAEIRRRLAEIERLKVEHERAEMMA